MALSNANNPRTIEIPLGSLAADLDEFHVWNIGCVADVSDSLDGTYFILEDDVGTVAFWIDTDDSGTTEPAHGADRSVEITTIATDDSAADVATKVRVVINADSKFSASVTDDDITVTSSTIGEKGEDEGTAGFTITTDTEGADGAVTRPAVYFPRAVKLASAVVINGANLAASDTDYVKLSLKNGSTEIAELDTRAAHENGLAINVAKALNIVSGQEVIAAGSSLHIEYDETEGTSVGLTNAKVVLTVEMK